MHYGNTAFGRKQNGKHEKWLSQKNKKLHWKMCLNERDFVCSSRLTFLIIGRQFNCYYFGAKFHLYSLLFFQKTFGLIFVWNRCEKKNRHAKISKGSFFESKFLFQRKFVHIWTCFLFYFHTSWHCSRFGIISIKYYEHA